MILRVGGELDLATVTVLRRHLSDHLGDRRDVVLDLEDLTFLSGHGTTVLLEAQRLARSHGVRLSITRLAYTVARLLRITGFGEDLDLSAAEPIDIAAEFLARRRYLADAGSCGHAVN